ncbi:MAG: hypothetical protein CALGDGBN_01933 [Pseudomonadales bacterium]|nr:hypothetical protein [Pseudomonadales bacterium]
MGELPEQRVTGIEHGVGRQIDRIAPPGHVGHGVPAIAHAPHQRGVAALGDRRRAHRDLDLQVRVRCIQRDRARRQPGVVGARVGLEHLAQCVADHAEVERALQLQRHRDAVHRLVTFAGGQRAAARHRCEHDVVGVADHVVAAQHDAVRPRRLRGRDRALVLHGPADFDRIAPACRRGCRQRLDRQVRIIDRGRAAHDHGLVVAFGVDGVDDLAHVVAHIGGDGDLDVARATHAGRQHEHELPRPRFAGRRHAAAAGERRIELQLRVQQHLAGGGVAHHDAVVPATHRRGIAGVQVVPRHRHRRPGPQPGRQHREVRHPQVRRRGDRELRGVVALAGAFGIALGDFLAGVRAQRELEPSDRTVAARPGEGGAAFDVRTGREFLADIDGAAERGVVDQRAADEVAHLDAVGPRHGHGRVAVVVHPPAQRHGAARRPAGGRLDHQVRDREIRVACESGRDLDARAVVVLGLAEGTLLGHGVGHVGEHLDGEASGAGAALRQPDHQAARGTRATRQRLVLEGDEHVGDQLAAAIQIAHHHALGPRTRGVQVAGVRHRPRHPDLAAGLDGVARHRGDGQILHHEVRAGAGAEHDLDRLRQRHVADVERVARLARGVIAALDQQRVGAAVGQRQHVDVATGTVHVRRPEDRAPPRIEQSPVHVTAGTAGDVEVEALARLRIEAVHIGFRRRAQRTRDGGSGLERGRLRQVEQPEAVAAGDLVRVGRVGGRVHRQRVGARTEVVDRGAVRRIAVPERFVRHHRAARSAQRPAQVVAVVAGVRRQAVEIHPRGLVQREGVDVALPRHRDRLALRLAEHQRRRRLVGNRVHAHAVAAGRRLVVARFQQQRVFAVVGERQRAHILGVRRVVEAGRAEHGAPERIEQPPACIAAAARLDVEEVLLTGRGREAVRVGFRGRIEAAADGGVERQFAGRIEVEQPETVAAGDLVRVARVRRRMHGQRVGARTEVVDRGAVRRIAVPERFVRHHRAERATQRPAQIVTVVARARRQAVEIHPRGFVQREGVDVALPRHRDRLALRLAEHQIDRLVGDRVHPHAVTAHRGLVVARLEQQRVFAVVGQCQRTHILVIRRVVEPRRTEHRAPEGIEQPPACITPAARHDIEEVFLPGHGREAVGVAFVRGIEAAAHRGVGRKLGGLCQIEQPESVAAGAAVDAEHVVPGAQVEHAQSFGRIAGREGLASHPCPARAAQRPAQRGIVRQCIEIHPRRRIERERVAIDLAARAQRPVRGFPQREFRIHRCGAGGERQRHVVQVVVRAPAAVARTEGHPSLVGQHAGDEIILDDRDLAAPFRRQVHRHRAAAVGGPDHEARVVELAVVEPEPRHQRVQVELGQLAAVEVQRDVVVADLAVVGRVETDTETAAQVRFLAELRRVAAAPPGGGIQPRETDAVALAGDARDAQVEADLDRRRQHVRMRRREADRVGAGDIARQQAQEAVRVGVAVGNTVVREPHCIEVEAVAAARCTTGGADEADIPHLGQPRTRQVVGTRETGIAVRLVTAAERDTRRRGGRDIDVIDAVQADLDAQRAELVAAGIDLVDVEVAATAVEQPVVAEVVDHRTTGAEPGVAVIGCTGEHAVGHAHVVVMQGRREMAHAQHRGQHPVAVTRRGVRQAGAVEILPRVAVRVRDRGVDHAETQPDRVALADAALDQQVIGAFMSQRRVQIRRVRRAEHHVAPRVDQPPVHGVAVLGQQVEQEAAARTGVEAIDQRLVAAGQRGGDRFVEADVGGLCQIEQAEAVVAGHIAVGIDDQRVVTGDELQQRIGREVGGVAVAERARGHHGAARSGQAPLERTAVRQRIEIQRRRRIEREAVAMLLPCVIDRRRDFLVERERALDVGDRPHVEGVGHVAAHVHTAFEQQRVLAVPRQRDHAGIGVERGRAEHIAAERIDQPPVGVAAAAGETVEVEPLPGARAEAVGIGFLRRSEHPGHRRAGFDGGCLAKVEQPEREGGRTLPRLAHAQRVVAGRQVEHGAVVPAVVGIALVERPVRDDGSARTGERPAQRRTVGQRIEIQPRRRIERERMVHALPRGDDGTADHAIGARAHQRRVAVSARIGERVAAVLVGLQVRDQPGLVADEGRVPGGGDILGAARHLPDPHVVDAAEEGGIVRAELRRVADQQRHLLLQRRRRAQRPAGTLDAVDQQPHLATGAVQHDRDVMPRAGGQHTGGALRVLRTAGVGAADRDRAIAVQPHRVAARGGAGALVEKRRPRVLEAIDEHVRLERDRAGTEFDVGAVGDLEVLVAVQRERAVQSPVVEARLHAARGPGRDRDRGVGHRQHAKAVIGHRGELVAPPLDQQRVGAGPRQRAQPHVVVGHVVRAPHRAPPRIEQPPVRGAAAGGGHVEEQRIAGRGVEAVKIGLVARTQLSRDGVTRREPERIREVEQAEGVDPPAVRGGGNTHLVVARRQRQDAAAVAGVALLERPIADHRAARTAEVPAQVVVVGQRIEIQRALFGEREPVHIVLTRIDAPGDHAGAAVP